MVAAGTGILLYDEDALADCLVYLLPGLLFVIWATVNIYVLKTETLPPPADTRQTVVVGQITELTPTYLSVIEDVGEPGREITLREGDYEKLVERGDLQGKLIAITGDTTGEVFTPKQFQLVISREGELVINERHEGAKGSNWPWIVLIIIGLLYLFVPFLWICGVLEYEGAVIPLMFLTIPFVIMPMSILGGAAHLRGGTVHQEISFDRDTTQTMVSAVSPDGLSVELTDGPVSKKKRYAFADIGTSVSEGMLRQGDLVIATINDDGEILELYLTIE